jgi:hypothetical protein
MHYVIAVVIAFVAGVVAGYAFRGKEHAALAQVGADVQGAANKVASGVSSVGKKL